MSRALRRIGTVLVSTFFSLSLTDCARSPVPRTAVPGTLHTPQWEDGVAALKRLEPQAQQCRQDGQPEGWALVRATFAGNGSVRAVTVPSGRYAGTPVAECLIALVRKAATIAPFDAEIVDVQVGITIGHDTAPAFDRGAAVTTLADATSHANRGECGGHGDGHVKTTFLPDGSVGEVLVDVPPGETPGLVACIEALYRACRMPAFAGSPVSVGHSVHVR